MKSICALNFTFVIFVVVVNCCCGDITKIISQIQNKLNKSKIINEKEPMIKKLYKKKQINWDKATLFHYLRRGGKNTPFS